MGDLNARLKAVFNVILFEALLAVDDILSLTRSLACIGFAILPQALNVQAFGEFDEVRQDGAVNFNLASEMCIRRYSHMTLPLRDPLVISEV
jgi:hypothetical protein